jgi:hypothetical protein
MANEFQNLGMGFGVKPGARNLGAKMPEEIGRGKSAVYDAAREAGASVEQALEVEARNVYGENAKQDRNGNWIEQGIGSKGNESIGHYQSIRKFEGEISYQRALKEIWSRDPNHARKLGLPEPAKAGA